LGNIVYSFEDMAPNYKMTPYSMDSPLDAKEYALVINGNSKGPASTVENKIPELKAGQTGTIILELDQSFKNDRDIRFEITTQKGGVFVYTVISGQHLG
jgi:hypothetical protein